MALATTCPACKTSFKVNPEQLKLRKGLVRCGKCEHVFSGVDFLRYVRDKHNAQTEDSNTESTPVSEEQESAAALSPETETVVEDLNTAFFLPETQQDSMAAMQTGLASQTTESPIEKVAEPAPAPAPAPKQAKQKNDSEPESNRKQTRSKSSRRNSRRRKRRRATDRDPNAKTPSIAAIEDRRHTGRRRADGSEPPVSKTKTNAATGATPPRASGER